MKYIPPKRSVPAPGTPTDPYKAVVLYVEDDEVNQQVARTRLAKKYDLLLASNDREACQLATEHSSKIVLVLMDIELKGSRLNGIDLTRLLRGKLDADQRPPYAQNVPSVDVPILFVTAYGQRFLQAELLGAGGDAV